MAMGQLRWLGRRWCVAEVLHETLLWYMFHSTNKGNRLLWCMFPSTNKGNREEYKRKMEDTKRCIEYLMETKEKLVMAGDFSSKEVKREEWTVDGGGDSWGGELLRMPMEDSMTQWVEEDTGRSWVRTNRHGWT